MTTRNQNILVVIFCVLLVLTNVTLWTYNWKYMKSDEYNEEVSRLNGLKDSLINVNDSLILVSKELSTSVDSLKNEVGKVDSVVVETEKVYEKDFIDITNQSIAADARFFSEYLSEDSTRFNDSNNSPTTETH
jgi:hypothetical protein